MDRGVERSKNDRRCCTSLCNQNNVRPSCRYWTRGPDSKRPKPKRPTIGRSHSCGNRATVEGFQNQLLWEYFPSANPSYRARFRVHRERHKSSRSHPKGQFDLDFLCFHDCDSTQHVPTPESGRWPENRLTGEQYWYESKSRLAPQTLSSITTITWRTEFVNIQFADFSQHLRTRVLCRWKAFEGQIANGNQKRDGNLAHWERCGSCSLIY